LIIVALAVSAMVASVVAHLNPDVVANVVWRHIVTIVSYFLPIILIIAQIIPLKISPTIPQQSKKIPKKFAPKIAPQKIASVVAHLNPDVVANVVWTLEAHCDNSELCSSCFIQFFVKFGIFGGLCNLKVPFGYN
jgi:hypothetical protein